MISIVLLALLAAARASAPAPAAVAEAPWMPYADCAAAHYADAEIIDLGRSAAQKAAILQLGRRYSAVAADTLRSGPAAHRIDPAFEHVKAYVQEKTRLLALRTRPDVQAAIGTCPKLP